MLAKLGVLLAGAALPFLCLQCVTSHGLVIQEGLKMVTSAALDGASIKGVKVGADGRDIVLDRHRGYRSHQGAGGNPGVRAAGPCARWIIACWWPPSAAGVQTKLNEILLKKKIEFQTNSDVILPVSTPVLEEALAVLKQAPQLSITINGHTDSVGIPAANKVLSARRAQAVAAWFGSHGVDAARLTSAGYGSEKPIDTNDTDAGRAQNRRVEIVANAPVVVGGK